MRYVVEEGGQADCAILGVESRIQVLSIDLDDIVGVLPIRTSLVWPGRPWEGVRVSELVGDVNESVPKSVHVETMRVAVESGGEP